MDTATEHPIDRVLQILGTTLEGLGRELGVSKGAVSQWKLPGRVTPADHCPRIERLTGGMVRCEELNPKVDWAYLRTGGETPAQPVCEVLEDWPGGR